MKGWDRQLVGGTPPPFNVWYRANTGSAKNTPKSDMEMLARIQHLATLNWASHRMAARSPTNRGQRPGARSWIGIYLLPQ
jgi:hypothetical protein